ncbi:ECF transporter S component [Candidatus Bathyarchaeota archaeon]|nr:ECF transporter S component [Candidatus Bathyarchaeota archaeon]
MPTVSFGPYSVSIALDLSHITTFVSALYGGPAIGGLTGIIGGFVAANEFGFSKGNLITGFTLPLGKALTGVVAGIVMTAMRLKDKNHHQVHFVSSTLISYIPEAIYTVFIFLAVFPMIFGTPVFVLYPIVVGILIKALVEMVAEGVLLLTLANNQGFTTMVKSFFIKS